MFLFDSPPTPPRGALGALARGVASLALAGLVSSSAAAQSYRDSLVQAPSLAPPTRGSVAGALASLRYGASELARGSFQLPSPFAAPSDRGPMLAPAFPSYSPDGGLSEWGMGWSADLSIRRFRTLGTLDYQTDELISPWGRLVEGDDGALYPAGLEQRVRVVRDGGGFVATLPDGARWIFRAADAITVSRGTYAWNVSEVSSAAGDRTELVWEASPSGRRFVSEIRWGGRGARREMRARLEYEPVSVPIADYASGARLLLDRRVRRVSVESRDHASGAFAERWAYELGYDESPAGAAFYLASVTQRFPSGAAEPPVTYGYAMAEDRLSTAALEPMHELDGYLAQVGGTGIQPDVVALFDLEDDGRVDMEHRYDHALVHHTDAGWTWEGAPPRDGTESPICRPAPSHSNRPRLLVRMTPDAPEPEVVVAVRSGASTGLMICDRQGRPLHQEGVAGAWDLGANTRLVDLDRDLRPDFVRVFRGGYEVLRNVSDEDGYRFERLAPGVLSPAFTPTATWVQDMNGDGLADLVARSTTSLVVWFGLGGDRFETNGTSLGFLASTGPVTNLGSFEITFTDANRDGLADALLSSGRYLMLFTNRGTHFRQVAVPGFSSIHWTVGLPVAVDLDGRGEEQAVLVNGRSAYRVTLSTPEAGLMVRADDGRGGEVRFAYRRARPTPGIERRPPMLTRMEITATGGGHVAYDYDYDGAVFHSAARHLLGFGTVRRDSPNGVESASFHFDDDVSGVLTETRSAADELDAFRFDRRAFEEASFRGVRLLRLREREAGWSDSAGVTVRGTTTVHDTYEDTLCVTRARARSPHGELVTEHVLEPLPALGGALHCTPREVRNVGIHAGRPELDFDYRAALERDALGALTRMTAIAGSERLVLQEVEYDALHRVAAITSPAEGRSVMHYDAATGLLASITSPDGVTTAVTRDPRTDALTSLLVGRGPGAAWTRSFRYDARERLEATWDDVGASDAEHPDTEYEYRYADRTHPAMVASRQLVDASSGSIAETIELQAATGAALATAVRTSSGWAFDGLSLVDPAASRTDRFHRAPVTGDPHALSVDALTDPAQRTALGHRVESALGHTLEELVTVRAGVTRVTGERLALAAEGVVHESLENGQVVGARIADGDGRTIASRDAAGALTTQRYDALGRLVQVALPGGAVQSVRFDAFGRVGTVERSGVGRTEHRYDALGRMAAMRWLDADGALVRELESEHDTIGRVVRETYRGSDGAEIAYEHTFGTEPGELGHLVQVRGPGFVRRMWHGRDGRPARTELELVGFRTIVIDRAYAEDGSERSVKRTVLSATGSILTSTEQTTDYDALGRVARLRLDGAPLYELAYDDEGRVSDVRFANGEALVMRFDPVTHQPVGYDHVASDWSLGVEVERDARGLVSAERIEMTRGDGAPEVHDREYAYDARRFLTERRGPDGASSYTYDAASRLASATDLEGARGYQRDGDTVRVGGETYAYDRAGRVIRRDELEVAYGPHGELERATRDGRTLRYLYDESGERLMKLDGTRVIAAFVGGAYLTETALVEPVEIAGRLVGVLVNGAYRPVATDPRGSVLASDDGTFLDASPYGHRVDRTELMAAFDFVQHGHDPDLGLVRMGARDYDPGLGEFWTPDPLYFGDLERCASDPVQCTLYAYASNDPIGLVDPSGLEEDEIEFVVIELADTHEQVEVTTDDRIGNFELGADARVFDVFDLEGIGHRARTDYNAQTRGRYERPWYDYLPWTNYEEYVVYGPSKRITEGDVEGIAAIFRQLAFGGYFPSQALPDSGVSVRLEIRDAYAIGPWVVHHISGSGTYSVNSQSSQTWNQTDTATLGGSGYGVTGTYSHGQQRGGSRTSGRTNGGTGGGGITMRGRLVVGRAVLVTEKREGNVHWRRELSVGYRKVFQTAGPN